MQATHAPSEISVEARPSAGCCGAGRAGRVRPVLPMCCCCWAALSTSVGVYAQVSISNAAKEGAWYGCTTPAATSPRRDASTPERFPGTSNRRPPTFSIELQRRVPARRELVAPPVRGGRHYRGSAVTFALGRRSCPESSATASRCMPPVRCGLQRDRGSSARRSRPAAPVRAPRPRRRPAHAPFRSSRAQGQRAAGTWSATGFTGSVTTSGNGNFTIQSQSLAPGQPAVLRRDHRQQCGCEPRPRSRRVPQRAIGCIVHTNAHAHAVSDRNTFVPHGAEPGGSTVSAARTAWTNAGFTGSFSPSNGQNTRR